MELAVHIYNHLFHNMIIYDYEIIIFAHLYSALYWPPPVHIDIDSSLSTVLTEPFFIEIEWEIKPPWSESVNENLMEKLASGEYCCYHSGGLSARKYLNVKNISGVKNICRINRSFLSPTHMANKWTEANSFGSRVLNIRLINSLKYGRIATKCGF